MERAEREGGARSAPPATAPALQDGDVEGGAVAALLGTRSCWVPTVRRRVRGGEAASRQDGLPWRRGGYR
eukprot:1652252-Pyramimonas_sp.AAC.1